MASSGKIETFQLTEFPQKHQYHSMLADAFLHGQVSLRVKPVPQLLNLPDPYDPKANRPFRLHDMSLYKGKYFLYYTPIVAIFIMAPFKATTGYFIPEPLLTALFCSIGFLVGFFALKRLLTMASIQLDFLTNLSCLMACAFVTTLPFLLRRPMFYELSIGAAYVSLMLSLYFFARILTSPKKTPYAASLFGLFLGLTILSRPTQIFACFVLAIGFVYLHYVSFNDNKKVMRQLIFRVGFPVAMILIGMLYYNFHRFGSFFEFGFSYNLSGFHPRKVMSRSISLIPFGLYNYIFRLPAIDLNAPFFHANLGEPPFLFLYLIKKIPYDKAYEYFSTLNYVNEKVIGLLGFPVYWLIFFPLFYLKQLYTRYQTLTLCSILFCIVGLVSMASLSIINTITMRYVVDFSPILLLSILLFFLILMKALKDKAAQKLFQLSRIILFCAVLMSSFVSFGITFTSLPFLY